MTPLAIKDEIDQALALIDKAGFRIDYHHGYSSQLVMFTKGNNEHGFANDIPLEIFNSWREVLVFMAGWDKRELVYAMAKGRK